MKNIRLYILPLIFGLLLLTSLLFPRQVKASYISEVTLTNDDFNTKCPGADSTWDICFSFEAFNADTMTPISVVWNIEKECNQQADGWHNNFKPNWYGPNCNSGSGTGPTFNINAGSCTMDWKVTVTAEGYESLPAFYPGGDGSGKPCDLSSNCPLLYQLNGNVAKWQVFLTKPGAPSPSEAPPNPSVTPTETVIPSPSLSPSPSPSPTLILTSAPTIAPTSVQKPPPTTIPPGGPSGTPPPTTISTPTLTSGPTLTQTPSFNPAACKCDGIEYTEIFSGASVEIASYAKVEGADVSRAKVQDQKFFFVEGAETSGVIIARSGPILATIISNATSKVRYQSRWQLTMPQLKTGATYRIWSQINCQQKTSAQNFSPGTASVLAESTKTDLSFFDKVFDFIAKIFIKPQPTVAPTSLQSKVAPSQTVSSPFTTAARESLQLEPIYPAEVYQKTCSFIKFRVQ